MQTQNVSYHLLMQVHQVKKHYILYIFILLFLYLLKLQCDKFQDTRWICECVYVEGDFYHLSVARNHHPQNLHSLRLVHKHMASDWIFHNLHHLQLIFKTPWYFELVSQFYLRIYKKPFLTLRLNYLIKLWHECLFQYHRASNLIQ